MLQFIVQFLPLIFLCAAFGVVLLNFDAVAAYVVYVISMLIQPKELIQATNEMSHVPLPPPEQKRKFSPFRPFIRLYTLIIVLFFPSIDVEKLTGKKSKRNKESLVNVYAEKTQEEINKYPIKTYSVPSTDNLKTFRNSMDTGAPLSSPFKQAFPDVVNILDKINKIDKPESKHPAPPLENNINNTFSDFTAYDSKSGALNPITPKMEPILVAIPEPDAVIAAHTPSPLPNLEVLNPMIETPSDPAPIHTIPLPKNAIPMSTDPNKFDAIAALEKKVSELKKDTVHSVVGSVNYGDITKKSSEINNAKNVNVKIDKREELPRLPIPPAKDHQEDSLFLDHNNTISSSSINIFGLIGKFIMYTILSMPLVLVVGSIGFYLAQTGFNIGKLGGYPGWVSAGLESFVKAYIIKN